MSTPLVIGPVNSGMRNAILHIYVHAIGNLCMYVRRPLVIYYQWHALWDSPMPLVHFPITSGVSHYTHVTNNLSPIRVSTQ